jgi:hypothetical protein
LAGRESSEREGGRNKRGILQKMEGIIFNKGTRVIVGGKEKT